MSGGGGYFSAPTITVIIQGDVSSGVTIEQVNSAVAAHAAAADPHPDYALEAGLTDVVRDSDITEFQTGVQVTSAISTALGDYTTTAALTTLLGDYALTTAVTTAISTALLSYTATAGMNSAIAAAITAHEADASDPHAAALYALNPTADRNIYKSTGSVPPASPTPGAVWFRRGTPA